jgi:hypothetical protein
VTSDHSATIGGLLFSLVGAENNGFAVDDIRFGVGEQVVSPSVPEPSTWAMMILGFAGVGFFAGTGFVHKGPGTIFELTSRT